jgi:hypothetical protein
METAAQLTYSKVLESLGAWSGFQVLNGAMSEFCSVEIYLAGGALRDMCGDAGRFPRDIDLFIAGPGVKEFLECLAQTGTLTRGPFGSPRWFPAGSREIYADVIPIQHFYNGLWKCEDIVDALNQFDFSANAIALDLRSPRIFDPQNGLRDIQARVIRAVRFDYPDEPISEICSLSRLSVLWVRLLHYAKALGFTIEPVTMRWLRENVQFRRDMDLFGQIFFEPDIGLLSA